MSLHSLNMDNAKTNDDSWLAKYVTESGMSCPQVLYWYYDFSSSMSIFFQGEVLERKLHLVEFMKTFFTVCCLYFLEVHTCQSSSFGKSPVLYQNNSRGESLLASEPVLMGKNMIFSNYLPLNLHRLSSWQGSLFDVWWCLCCARKIGR